MKLLILGCSFSHGIHPSDFKKQIHTCYGWTHQLFKKYNIDLGARKFSK